MHSPCKCSNRQCCSSTESIEESYNNEPCCSCSGCCPPPKCCQFEPPCPLCCCVPKPRVKGKFGLAYIVETPKNRCCAPLGWQVEFKDTPSKITTNCKKMMQWVNCPPLGDCLDTETVFSPYPNKCTRVFCKPNQVCCCDDQAYEYEQPRCCRRTKLQCEPICCKSQRKQKTNKGCCQQVKCCNKKQEKPRCCCKQAKSYHCCEKKGNSSQCDDSLDYVPDKEDKGIYKSREGKEIIKQPPKIYDPYEKKVNIAEPVTDAESIHYQYNHLSQHILSDSKIEVLSRASSQDVRHVTGLDDAEQKQVEIIKNPSVEVERAIINLEARDVESKDHMVRHNKMSDTSERVTNVETQANIEESGESMYHEYDHISKTDSKFVVLSRASSQDERHIAELKDEQEGIKRNPSVEVERKIINSEAGDNHVQSSNGESVSSQAIVGSNHNKLSSETMNKFEEMTKTFNESGSNTNEIEKETANDEPTSKRPPHMDSRTLREKIKQARHKEKELLQHEHEHEVEMESHIQVVPLVEGKS